MVETILSYLPKRKKGQQLKICDLTCGGGGHSEAMLMHYVKEGKRNKEEYKEGQAKEGQDSTGEVTVYGVDQDEESGKQTRERLGKFMEGVEGVKFMGINKNFGDLNCQDFQGSQVDFVLGDLGVSSHQIDLPSRGFSYSHELTSSPLDMRMSSSLPLTAADICNEWSEEVIRKVLVELGDEDWRVAGKIAGSIVERRPLKTTGDLVDAINNVVPKWSKKSPRKGALKTTSRAFQALRVAVNDEVGVLERLFEKVLPEITKSGGTVAVLTYQSMEDRVTKQAFTQHYESNGGIRKVRKESIEKDLWGNDVVEGEKVWDVVNRGGEKARKEEVEVNSRARSARLRVAKRGKRLE
ncbi:hypothetical protein TrCOL_g7303 [Triparma columacea]|uniref:Ribosomal RNA small subunit methyltransferase H n=1 Tax=Triparma columacea TaxID=722753 RepID=A0A9W7FXQ8_9STRA|nr:hypothetical protein TrCOL_g7303 [Triparma columacea]